MARRRVNTFLELDGPLFDEGAIKRVKDALAEGMDELGDTGAEFMMGFIAMGGFVRTGGFMRSVDSELRRNTGGAGWVKVYPTGGWSGEPGSGPTRTWMETGRRGSVGLRKGVYAFRKTAQRLNAMKYDQVMLPKLIGALDGD